MSGRDLTARQRCRRAVRMSEWLGLIVSMTDTFPGFTKSGLIVRGRLQPIRYAAIHFTAMRTLLHLGGEHDECSRRLAQIVHNDPEIAHDSVEIGSKRNGRAVRPPFATVAQ